MVSSKAIGDEHVGLARHGCVSPGNGAWNRTASQKMLPRRVVECNAKWRVESAATSIGFRDDRLTATCAGTRWYEGNAVVLLDSMWIGTSHLGACQYRRVLENTGLLGPLNCYAIY
jgi:hypothetical protein